MHEVIMPKLGLTMETGKIEKWHKKEGDKVEAGEILFETMTDKVSLEVEAYESGYLRKILYSEGSEVAVTEIIAYIGRLDEKIPEQAGVKEPVNVKEIEIDKEALTEEKIEVKNDKLFFRNSDFKKISPLAKRIAREMGIDYKNEDIVPSGFENRIVRADILNFHEKKEKHRAEPIKTAPVPDSPAGIIKIKEILPIKGKRKVIAEKMTYSKQNIPHINLTSVICMDSIISLREKINKKAFDINKIKITFTDFIVKACAYSILKHDAINSSLQEENQIIYEDINISLGIDTAEGLVVATIYNADKLSIFEIAKKRSEIIEKAKNNSLKLEDISNATFTISNLGMFGIRNFTAIINPPQGAILTIGEIYKSAVQEDKNITFKSYMDICLAVDHRIIDGADGARYLTVLKEILENPEMFLI